MNKKRTVLPMIPLRGLVVLPYMILHFDVGRPKSIKALEAATEGNQLIFLVTQHNDDIKDPTIEQLYTMGTIAKISHVMHSQNGTMRVMVEGVSRAELIKMSGDEYSVADVLEHRPESVELIDDHTEALMRKLKDMCERYFELENKSIPDAMASVIISEDPGRITDLLAGNMDISVEDKQSILDRLDPIERLEQLLFVIARELELVKIENEIDSKVKASMEKNQRDYYLREQLQIIQEELGDKDGIGAEISDYREKFAKLDLPEEVFNKVEKELDRLFKTPPGMGEGTVIRNYLDWVCDLPWNKSTEDSFDLEKAEKILEEDHYGLEKVKERIMEYLAVRKLSTDSKAPILCLVGPPGVGKTSIAKSIATAMNKNYVRISLGGVHDESEIRGHRRTYLGSMPGRIITALKQAGSNNPLMLFDEIDKLASGVHGDPSAAMLEVLDGEQNSTFRDNYMEVPFDLSRVTFLTTANQLDTIPRPLLDRMEIIELSGYIEDEKFNIAKRHLVPKQLKLYGLGKSAVKFSDEALHHIINFYTREAGVRNLEREIGRICRKAARKIVTEGKKSVSVTAKNLETFLGGHRFSYDLMKKEPEIGISTGLAWTAVGGDTLDIEVNIMPGTGKTELTGSLGDVMKESAMAAISYIRSKCGDYKIPSDFYKTCDIHIHVPEGATPKDGPSAGITIATALVSALSGLPVRHDVAMTGEITLRGRVLPIGGLKEKSIASYRSGIRTIIIPHENVKDLEEIPEHIRKEIKFAAVKSVSEVFDIALCKVPSYSDFSSVATAIRPQTAKPKEISNRI